MNNIRILVAEDDLSTRRLIVRTLEKNGYPNVVEVKNGKGLRLRMSHSITVVCLDLTMPQTRSLDALTYLNNAFPEVPVIVISGGSISDAVSAMKKGAFWFIEKPISRDLLLSRIREAISFRLSETNGENTNQSAFVGSSQAVKSMLRSAREYAQRNEPILLLGEFGVGKRHLAEIIHHWSPRQNAAFVQTSSASIFHEFLDAELFGVSGLSNDSVSKLDEADGGTLYLDAVSELPLRIQAKIASFITTKSYPAREAGIASKTSDTRIIVSTSDDLGELVKKGTFRQELYYALTKNILRVPSLRERKEDLGELSAWYLRRWAMLHGRERMEITEDALQVLATHTWPGNLPELENVLYRAADRATSGTIFRADISIESQAGFQKLKEIDLQLGGMTLEDLEKKAISQTLEMFNGNRSRAARSLGIAERTIYAKIKQFGL